MTKDLENLINLIYMSSASSILLSGNLISQPEKIALQVAQSFLCKDIKKNNSNLSENFINIKDLEFNK